MNETVAQIQPEVRDLRQDTLTLSDAAVESVRPQRLMRQALRVSRDGTELAVDEKTYILQNNVYVVGFGKAVSAMARTLEDLTGLHIVKGIISVPCGSQALFKSQGNHDFCVNESSKIEVFEGARNNLPDEDAHRAALAILDLVKDLTQDDLLIILIAGGGSALLPTPIPPLSAQNIQDVSEVLSKNGATIQELNYVRQNIEILKGSGLAQIAKPAKILTLVLCDVIGDKMDIEASGPTVPTESSPEQCLQILKRLSVVEKVPQVVIEVLEGKISRKNAIRKTNHKRESSKYEFNHVHNVIIGRNSDATANAAQMAEQLGYILVVLTNELQGEASLVAQMLVRLAKYVILSANDNPSNPETMDLSGLKQELHNDGLFKSKQQVMPTGVERIYV